MTFERIWATPNGETFTIPPIAALLKRYEVGVGCWVDPFAGNSTRAQVTNDLNPSTCAQTHEDALVWLRKLPDASCSGVLFDPPYSITQAAQLYKSYGQNLLTYGPGNMRYWAAVKTQTARVIKPGGLAICCGWTSQGLGKGRGFTLLHVLLVPHGGSKNDTIATVERKEID